MPGPHHSGSQRPGSGLGPACYRLAGNKLVSAASDKWPRPPQPPGRGVLPTEWLGQREEVVALRLWNGRLRSCQGASAEVLNCRGVCDCVMSVGLRNCRARAKREVSSAPDPAPSSQHRLARSSLLIGWRDLLPFPPAQSSTRKGEGLQPLPAPFSFCSQVFSLGRMGDVPHVESSVVR